MLTAGQVKYAAFKAELSKLSGVVDWVANRPLTSAAISSAGMGAYNLLRHGPWGEGGRSKPETKDIQKSQSLEGAELKKALKDQKSHALASEAAGAGLGTAGMAGAGLLANKYVLGPSIEKAEKGLVTSNEELSNLWDRTKSTLTAKGAPVPELYSAPGKGLGVGTSLPKGGYLPSFLNNWEAKQNAGRFRQALSAQVEDLKAQGAAAIHAGLASPEEAESVVAEKLKYFHPSLAEAHARSAIKNTGATIVPTGVGPHVAAHEMGHSLFGATRAGKVNRALRLPGYLGTMAGTAMAATSDPDSTTSKIAPLVSAAGIAPYLGEELGASMKGMKLMREAGGFSPAQLSTARKQMGKAFGTYAAGIGLPVIAAPYIIRKFREHNRKRRDEKGIESPGKLQSRIDALGE
ncbi:hypothetical protein UFOVP276_47 [uncultured Caudovirales phage]|uniref:Uncharacterized protein n=1 Tax=uncultured Caudovirales phage TaxID=2100421 RepID=A0A6J5LTJ3_9CAUD|nr:hypothetical protein UFOVP127_184 [uncultured Caudovirales phage]CAB4135019.1 hypothetical protein UFOVP276_47 [uncultured Caudovirales phage]